jgi:hypothetical protein
LPAEWSTFFGCALTSRTCEKRGGNRLRVQQNCAFWPNLFNSNQ